jgi:hypothetical protein
MTETIYRKDLQYQKDKLKKNLEHLVERSRENELLSEVIVDYQRYEERLHQKDQQLTQQTFAKMISFLLKLERHFDLSLLYEE